MTIPQREQFSFSYLTRKEADTKYDELKHCFMFYARPYYIVCTIYRTHSGELIKQK